MTPGVLGRAWERSLLVSAVARGVEGSLVLDGAGRAIARVRRQRVTTDRTSLGSRLSAAYGGSALRRLERLSATHLRGSSAVRWFARDSRPEEVVVDLRDSRVVGPVLVGIVRLGEGLGSPRGWPASGRVLGVLAALHEGAERSWIRGTVQQFFAAPGTLRDRDEPE